MTLHQSQGHRNEHEPTYHSSVYRHAKRECHGANTVRDMAIIAQVTDLSRLRRSCDHEWRARASDMRKDYVDLYSDYILNKVDGDLLEQLLK